jgi:carbon-monoxide dehydrogenase medium subunit/xanthine dehydrogenase FAD-binding subunit
MVGITGERWSTPYKRPALGKLVERAVEDLLEEAGYNG